MQPLGMPLMRLRGNYLSSPTGPIGGGLLKQYDILLAPRSRWTPWRPCLALPRRGSSVAKKSGAQNMICA